MEMLFGVTFVDGRLVFRELKHRFRTPSEYQPWVPEISSRPLIPVNTVVYLDPLTGTVDVFYKYEISSLPTR